jgi:hypothetical protein
MCYPTLGKSHVFSDDIQVFMKSRCFIQPLDTSVVLSNILFRLTVEPFRINIL